MPQKIVSLIGARPQFVKAAVVSEQLAQHPELTECLVHSGQHYDYQMSNVFFDELSIPTPTHHLAIGSGSHGAQTAKILASFEEVLLAERPDWVLVYGDTNTTVAGALAATKLHIKLAHVESGLRSFNRRMPEEINRLAVDAIADLLFTTEPSGSENLRAEGVAEERIHFVGNVMIDTLLAHRERASTLDTIERLGLESGGYAVLTRTRLSDDSGFTKTLCQQNLSNGIINLVRSCMAQLFPFKIDPGFIFF